MYPYQKLDLEDLRGEAWEDIPFLDGLYRISNLGRVKRLDIEINCCNGQTRRLPSKILQAYLNRHKNNSVNDYNYFLAASITYQGKTHKFSVARLVYYCFKKKFALDDYDLVVFAKDGNGKNIKPSNLKLADLNHKQKRIFERGRFKIEYETTYDEYINKGKIKSKNPHSKQVSQYTLQGKLLKTFPSIRVAEKIAGVAEAGIVSVLKKRQISSGGYVWGYGRKKAIDVAGIRKANNEHRKMLVGRKVTQYNLQGKRIATFFAIADAAQKTNISSSDIHAVLNGKQRSAGGFIWREGFGESRINVDGFLTGEAWRAFRRQKKVKQYSSAGKSIPSTVSLPKK